MTCNKNEQEDSRGSAWAAVLFIPIVILVLGAVYEVDHWIRSNERIYLNSSLKCTCTSTADH